MNDRFNVSFQRALPHAFVVDTTFFLNLGANLPYTHEFNLTDPRLSYEHQGALNKQVANPFYNYMTPETFPGSLRNQKTVPLSSLLKPYPQYSSVSQQGKPGPRTRYDSVQIKLQRPFSDGFNFLLGYNYNNQKVEEFFSADEQFLNQWSWQRSTGMRHKLNVAGVWELPFGRGRHLMTKANTLLEAALGGWIVSGVYSYVAGDSLRFGALVVSGDPVLPNPDKWSQWFNPKVFAAQPAFTRRSNPLYFNDLWGPSAHVLDASFSKQFRITERLRLEFRMESNNLTNTFNAANPNATISNSNFGRITGPRSAHFGRHFQYNVKLHF